MQTFHFEELEEYRREKFVLKPVYEGVGSKMLLLHLLPEQEVPLHPHLESEVTLIPHSGEAVLFYEDGTEVVLKADSFYYGGLAPVFGIQNRGTEPFQSLVLLVRVAATEK